MTLPKAKGGLGFWSLSIVMEALRMKTAWSFLTSDSLWAAFLWNKYIKIMPLAFNDPLPIAIRYWTHIWSCILKTINMAYWGICKGEVTLLYKNWIVKGRLCNSLEVEDDFVCNTLKEASKINFMIPGLTQNLSENLYLIWRRAFPSSIRKIKEYGPWNHLAHFLLNPITRYPGSILERTLS